MSAAAKKLHNVGKTYYAAKGAVPCYRASRGIDVFVIEMSSNKPVRDAISLLARSIKSELGGQIQTLAICGMSSSAPAELMVSAGTGEIAAGSDQAIENLARLAPFGAAVPRCSDRVPARSRAVRSEALRIAMKAN
jgi:hypothetical protein